MNRKLRKAFVIPSALSRMSHAGQVPNMGTKRAAAETERAFKMPKVPSPNAHTRDTSPRLTTASVVDGVGFDKARFEDYRKFLDEHVAASPNETRYRQALLQKMMDDAIDPDKRRVLADRATSYYRFRQSMAKKSMLNLDDLQKAEARGGRYYRRVTEEGKPRYYYDEGKYHERDDAHVSGRDAMVRRVAGLLSRRTPDEGLGPDEVAEWGEKFDPETVKAALDKACADGSLVRKGGRYVLPVIEKAELSSSKAREILHDGTVHGKSITDKQRRYFGAVASDRAQKSNVKETDMAKKSMDAIDELDDVGDGLAKAQSICEIEGGELSRTLEELPAAMERQKVAFDASIAGNGGSDPEADGDDDEDLGMYSRVKKSLEEPMDLDGWLMKSGGLPEGEPGYSEGTEVSRAEDGGKVAGVGKPEGTPQNTGNGSKADVGDTPSVAADKLSEDDAEVEKQMEPHTKPIERMGKSIDQANFRVISEDPVEGQRRHAQQMSQLRKSQGETVYIPPTRAVKSEPLAKSEEGSTFRVGRGQLGQGDLHVTYDDRLDRHIEKSIKEADEFYPHGRPTVGALGNLQKSEECGACGMQKSLALSACPSCGAGTAVQTLGVIGGGVLIKSDAPGPGLRRVRRGEAVVLPGGIVVVDD